MQEIRFHGRGGQGAVIASRILAQALFFEGRYAQSFPTFGAERRGAPVAAFVRADDAFINIRSRVTSPDYVIVMAARLIEAVPVSNGLKPGGLILINSDQPAASFIFTGADSVPGQVAPFRIITVNLNQIALKHGLGNEIMPLINAPVLGALAGVSGLVKPESLLQALPYFIPARLADNEKALLEAYEKTGCRP
ncbi:MAG: 2-oxoacid:acceptor oxidoreductase family protein [Deltaproteobacteria bacterium]|nr:2-oxoacid:acceptor oxidoreductase family protein [Deltaproteobacteria bacterium]